MRTALEQLFLYYVFNVLENLLQRCRANIYLPVLEISVQEVGKVGLFSGELGNSPKMNETRVLQSWVFLSVCLDLKFCFCKASGCDLDCDYCADSGSIRTGNQHFVRVR
jgi:hypothetical protein